jgi:RNA polymerase sigma-70 factor (ECF subfamily)
MGTAPMQEEPLPTGLTTASRLEILLERVRRREPGALNELLKYTEGRLRALTHRMLRSYPEVRRRDETGDVLQGALHRLVRALESVQPNNLEHFLRLAALNIRRELLTLARKCRLRPKEMPIGGDRPEGSDDGWHPVPDPASEPDELASWTEFHEQADALDEPERAVFDLLFYHELTQGEAADVLGVSEKTVQKRWASARRMIVEKTGGRLPDLD